MHLKTNNRPIVFSWIIEVLNRVDSFGYFIKSNDFRNMFCICHRQKPIKTFCGIDSIKCDLIVAFELKDFRLPYESALRPIGNLYTRRHLAQFIEPHWFIYSSWCWFENSTNQATAFVEFPQNFRQFDSGNIVKDTCVTFIYNIIDRVTNIISLSLT